MIRILITLTGKQGSGKSSLAQGLHECLMQRLGLETGYRVVSGVRETTIAGPLYEISAFIDSEIRGVAHEKNGKLLQGIGDAYRSAFGESSLIEHAMSAISLSHAEMDPLAVVVSDARLPSEVAAFRQYAEKIGAVFVAVSLTADQDLRKARTKSWREETQHKTESAMDAAADGFFDVTLDTGVLSKEQTLQTVMSVLNGKLASSGFGPEKIKEMQLESAVDVIRSSIERLNCDAADLHDLGYHAPLVWKYNEAGRGHLELGEVTKLPDPLTKEREAELAAATAAACEPALAEPVTEVDNGTTTADPAGRGSQDAGQCEDGSAAATCGDPGQGGSSDSSLLGGGEP